MLDPPAVVRPHRGVISNRLTHSRREEKHEARGLLCRDVPDELLNPSSHVLVDPSCLVIRETSLNVVQQRSSSERNRRSISIRGEPTVELGTRGVGHGLLLRSTLLCHR